VRSLPSDVRRQLVFRGIDPHNFTAKEREHQQRQWVRQFSDREHLEDLTPAKQAVVEGVLQQLRDHEIRRDEFLDEMDEMNVEPYEVLSRY
jgi:hypothetical protein